MGDWRQALSVGAPLLGLAVDVVLHLVLFRLRPSFGMLKAIIFCFVSGAVVVFFLGLGLGEKAGVVAANLMTFSLLGYCYFHFVNLGETARRIRILRELREAPQGLTQQELLRRYNAREILAHRMRRLLANGQVIEREGLYFIGSPLVLGAAGFLQRLKIVFLGRACESDTNSKEL